MFVVECVNKSFESLCIEPIGVCAIGYECDMHTVMGVMSMIMIRLRREREAATRHLSHIRGTIVEKVETPQGAVV